MNPDHKRSYVRQGDILNPFGVIQAVHLYDGALTKHQFIELVKLNYGIDKLTIHKEKYVNYCWEEGTRRMERCGALYYADDMIIRADLMNSPEIPFIRYKFTPTYKYYIRKYEEALKLWEKK